MKLAISFFIGYILGCLAVLGVFYLNIRKQRKDLCKHVDAWLLQLRNKYGNMV